MKSYKEYLSLGNPVLFLNFSYETKDAYGEKYAIEDLMKNHIKHSEFSGLDNIHFFNGDIYNNTTKLNNYSLIFIGPTGDSYENYILIENYCKFNGIPLLSYGCPNFLNNKYLQLQKLSNNSLKVPITYTFNSGDTCDIDFVEKNFTYPLVLKPAHGSQGRGVEIVKSRAEFKKLLGDLTEEVLMIQEFIPNDCDYRVCFVGDQHIFNVKRTRTDKKEFRNNVSLGAKGELVDIELEQFIFAKKAHKCLEFYASGVDLVQNKETKEWYILEVNCAPQYSIFGPEKTLKIFADDINMLKK